MCFSRIPLLLGLVLLSPLSPAAEGWFIKNAVIERVSVFSDSAYNGLHLWFRADPADVDAAMLGSSCPVSWEQNVTQANENKVVTWRSTGGLDAKAQAMYSTALAAQAQGRKVDIWLDTSSCINTSQRYWWGYMWDGLSIGP